MSVLEEKVPAGRTIGLDLLVLLLAGALVVFLLITMGIRTRDQAVVDDCQARMLALAAAQQNYLVEHGEFASELPALRPFLEPEHRGIQFTCPITGNDFRLAVQQDRYVIHAPGTGAALEREDGEDFLVQTGDPNW